MDHDEHSRWIVGESLDTLFDETRTFVVHNRFPRWVGAVQVEHGSVGLRIQWCECRLDDLHRERLTRDALDFLSTFGSRDDHGDTLYAESVAAVRP